VPRKKHQIKKVRRGKDSPRETLSTLVGSTIRKVGVGSYEQNEDVSEIPGEGGTRGIED